MATNISTSFTDSNSADAWQSLVDRRLLMRGTYDHFGMMFTDKKSFKQRQGKTMLFRRYTALAKQTTALTEAVTPTPLAKAKTDVNATLAAYGAWVEDSDFLAGTLPEGTLENVDLLAQNMGETMDELYLQMWAAATTNVTYANGSVITSVNTLPVYEDFNKALRSIRNNKAKRMTPMIAGSQKVGSGSIMPGYWCLCSESMFYDIRAGSTFATKFFLPSNYGNSAAITGEGGALDIGIRLLPVPDADALTGNLTAAGGGATGGDAAVIAESTNVADVHKAIIIGAHAAVSVDLGVGNGGVIRKALGSAGTADPLDQRTSIGWKKYDARKIVNTAFVQAVYGAVSA
jgi:N4-gp56 family major capsid protein